MINVSDLEVKLESMESEILGYQQQVQDLEQEKQELLDWHNSKGVLSENQELKQEIVIF